MIDDMMYLFTHYAWTFYLFVGFYSLMVGSFLNVVIYRLPKMIQQDCTVECRDFLVTEMDIIVPEKEEARISLSKPSSTCPSCDHKIRFYENIPIISWLVLGRKCSQCKTPISIRYPFVEALTALLSIVVAMQLGVTWATCFALILTWSLIALSYIDFDHFILPDDIVLPLLWLGLMVNINGTFCSLENAVIGAIAGYGVLYCLMGLYKLIRGKDGMGNGDFKLFAMFGAWFGWTLLPVILFVASIILCLVGLFLVLINGVTSKQKIPFGPCLASAGWLTLIWQEQGWYYYGLFEALITYL